MKFKSWLHFCPLFVFGGILGVAQASPYSDALEATAKKHFSSDLQKVEDVFLKNNPDCFRDSQYPDYFKDNQEAEGVLALRLVAPVMSLNLGLDLNKNYVPGLSQSGDTLYKAWKSGKNLKDPLEKAAKSLLKDIDGPDFQESATCLQPLFIKTHDANVDKEVFKIFRDILEGKKSFNPAGKSKLRKGYSYSQAITQEVYTYGYTFFKELKGKELSSRENKAVETLSKKFTRIFGVMLGLDEKLKYVKGISQPGDSLYAAWKKRNSTLTIPFNEALFSLVSVLIETPKN